MRKLVVLVVLSEGGGIMEHQQKSNPRDCLFIIKGFIEYLENIESKNGNLRDAIEGMKISYQTIDERFPLKN